MLNKLLVFSRENRLMQPGDHIVCAVSGGADSMALLFAMYLLREKLQITVSAAHFNHRLRGEESNRDEVFVREFCDRYDIELFVGSTNVTPGKKGLEAAARDARYAFLKTLPGKIATAHTADDNAETMLMHLVRGTGLKGLGGIAPANGNLIRPLLTVTRQDVLLFLKEYNLTWVNDSSNDTDYFLRNRIRHHVMPLLEQENPKLAENLSALALRLRQDEATLEQLANTDELPDVPTLRGLAPALRNRLIASFLRRCGVPEPESHHITLVDKLVFSEKPSASADLPGGITIVRKYNRLEKGLTPQSIAHVTLSCPGIYEMPENNLRVICSPAEKCTDTPLSFTVLPSGQMVLRSREPGDRMRLPGGSKDLKKLFIDQKIPAAERSCIPVIADDAGILGVYGIGANRERLYGGASGVEIRFEHML